MNIICNNCGKRGHTYNNCLEPVTSYGIIIFRFENDKPEILMINRKKSLCYIEFIRGKYNPHNIDYVKILIDKFTNSEKNNILNKSFDELWKDLWLLEDLDEKYKNNFEISKKKFNYLKNTNNLDNLISNSKSKYEETEWEFPKGRKNNNEKNMNCAIRECEEETNFNPSDYELLINVTPLNEFYVGENKIKYRHIYYIAELKNYDKKLILDKNINQSIEIYDMKWLNKKECLNKLRNYHKSRERIILNVFNFLENIEDYIII